MAARKPAGKATDDTTRDDGFQEMMDAVSGHDHIEVEDEDGNVWKFGYDRALVRKMEHEGFKVEDAMTKFTGSSLTDVEDFYRRFFLPAFRKYQPDATEDEFFAVVASVPDKEKFIGYMTALYMQPVTSITTNPTRSRTKLRLV